MKRIILQIGLVIAACMLFNTQNNTFAATAVTSGNWSDAATWGGVAPGGTITGDNINIPNGITVTLDIDVTFSALLNSITVDGTLSSTTSNRLTISSGALNGTGMIEINRLSFGVLSTASYTGDLMVNVLENNSALLTLAAVGTVSDSLCLEAGILTLGTGANLEIDTNAVIRRNGGSISNGSGILDLSNAYNVLYVGSSKTSGIEINSLMVENVWIQLDNNSQTLTLASDMRVDSVLHLSTGHLDIAANTLELYGDIIINTGAMLESGASSSIILETDNVLTSAFMFDAGSSLDMFNIDYSGTGNVQLGSDLDIVNELHLNEGDLSLETGSTLTMNAGSMIHVEYGGIVGNGGVFDGSAAYDIEYVGGTVITGLEFSGSGLNDVEINMTGPEEEIHFGGNVVINGHLELVQGWFHLEGYDLTMNGTFDQWDNGLFKGDIASELILNIETPVNDTITFKSDFQTLDKLTVNLTGAGDLVLGAGLTVENDLILTNGRIDVADNDLLISNGGVITDYDNNNYVVTSNIGRLKMYIAAGDSYVVFPVGDENNYAPASIQQDAAASSGIFAVNVFNGVYQYGSSGNDVALSESVVNNTWRIDAETGMGLNTNLKLGWVLASEVNGFDRDNAYISQYMAPWDTYTSSAAVTGVNSTYELERTALTTMGTYTVTDENSALEINEATDLVTVNLYPNPATDLLTVNFVQPTTDQYMYKVTDMSGRVYDLVNTMNNQFDVSFLSSGTYLLSMVNVETGEITVKEFIKK